MWRPTDRGPRKDAGVDWKKIYVELLQADNGVDMAVKLKIDAVSLAASVLCSKAVWHVQLDGEKRLRSNHGGADTGRMNSQFGKGRARSKTTDFGNRTAW